MRGVELWGNAAPSLSHEKIRLLPRKGNTPLPQGMKIFGQNSFIYADDVTQPLTVKNDYYGVAFVTCFSYYVN